MKDKPQRSRLWLTILTVVVIPIILFYFVDLENVLPILQHTDRRIMLASAVVLLVGFPIAAYLFRELATVRTI